jgi:hypothetical protein
MNNSTLEKKWSEVSHEAVDDYKSIRIAEDCIPDLYLSYNTESQRCLILSLSHEAIVDFKDEDREHISIRYFDESRHIVIQLTETRFYELFNSFITSVYYSIKSIANSREASNQLLRVYYEWSEFFSAMTLNKLSFTDVMGLVGELAVLNRLIRESPSENINNILNSWTGPFDKGHDFCFDAKDIEVKTKELSGIEITISSEFQLEASHGKELVLTVISVLINVEDAKTLNTIIAETKDLIVTRLGDLPIFLKAIARKGLTMSNAGEYDNYKFKIKSEASYDCMAEGFPKLIVSNIPKQIKHLKFNLIVSTLTDFIIEQIEY